MPDIAVPLGTYTGWNLRDASIGAPSEPYVRAGAFHPFAATRRVRDNTKDPRPAIEERYSGKADFLAKITAAADDLVRRGFLLESDRPRILRQAEERWTRLTAQ
jgi:hypothetical protein